LKINPQDRLGYRSFNEVKYHEWLKNIQWDKLYKKEIKAPFIPGKVGKFDSKRYKHSSVEDMDKIFNVLARTNYFDAYYYDFMSPISEYINQTEGKFYNLHNGESNKNGVVMYSYSTSTTNKPKITNNQDEHDHTNIYKRINSYTHLNKSLIKQNSISGTMINIKKFEKIDMLNKLKDNKKDQSQDILLL
jgi:hypothetical protein